MTTDTHIDNAAPNHCASHSFVICGFGSLGQYCVEGLRQFATDDSEISFHIINLAEPDEWVIDGKDEIAPCLRIADCRDPDALREAGIETAQAALFVTSDERVNIQAALAARAINPDVRLVVRSSKENLNQLLDTELGNFTAMNPADLPASAFVNAVVTSDLLSSFEVDSEEFQIYLAKRERLKERFDTKTISLSLETRLAEAEAEKELDSIQSDAFMSELELEEGEDEEITDLLLEETLHILSDFIELKRIGTSKEMIAPNLSSHGE